MNAWQPIETAPEMRNIIMWADTSDGQTRNWRMASGYINAAAGKIVWEGRAVEAWDFKPTHWQPMPSPPVSQNRVTTESQPETADAASGTLTEGGDVEQAPSDSLSGPAGNAGDAQ